MAKFIVFEGIDGSGKSTHSKLFSEYLNQKSLNNIVTCEPTYGTIGTIIRSVFTGKSHAEHATIANLFAADRFEHIMNNHDGLLQYLAKGQNVICDRYLLSSYAYQGSILNLKWIQQINAINEATLWPDITFYIDLNPEIAMQRILENRDSVELFETKEQLEKVYAHYDLAINDLSPDQKKSIIKINGNQSIEAIQADIQAQFELFNAITI